MSMFPHTVTVYNTEILPGADFSETTHVYTTILRGVFLDATKAVNVNKSGLVGADAVDLYIPFTVEAVDGVTGAPKQYISPMEFWALEDKSTAWTLSIKGNGGNTFFVKGEFVTDNLVVALGHDDAYNATKVDEKDFGGDMAHWRVGGA